MSFSMYFTIEADTPKKVIKEKIYGIWKADTAHDYHEKFVKVVCKDGKELDAFKERVA